MKKKLALSIISMDECFPQGGFSGGGHKVTKKLIEGLIASDKFVVDIFCKKSSIKNFDGTNSITVLNKKTFNKEFKNHIDASNYDYILSSDILVPFANNIIHSNSSAHKSSNGKTFIQKFILNHFNAKKIKNQKQNMTYDKAVFTVSESLRQDYIKNFNLNPEKVFTALPATDDYAEFTPPAQKDSFTIGSIVGGGLNKGGYLLLSSMKKLKDSSIRAKVIFPKYHKSGLFKSVVKILGLQDKIEILPRQADMAAYYNSIDCYVLPSLNEAFGLVVTEAASNSKPSLVSSTTGVRELIVDGEDGFVFDRSKNPTKNLAQKLKEIENIYHNDFEKFTQVAKQAHEIPQRLSWKTFTDTIINNMIGEADA